MGLNSTCQFFMILARTVTSQRFQIVEGIVQSIYFF